MGTANGARHGGTNRPGPRGGGYTEWRPRRRTGGMGDRRPGPAGTGGRGSGHRGGRHGRPSLARRVARWAGLAVVFLALAGAGVVAFAAATPLPKPQVPQATVVYDIEGRMIASLYRQNRQVARPEEIPRSLRQAVVAAEDARFYRHHGFDPVAIGRAVVRNLEAGRIVEGGSSITQQLARTLYDLSLERTVGRKFREALLAVKLETHYTKDQILTMYLNQVYFGRGAYGAKVAAREYFGKPLDELTLAESATLAAFIRGPEIYWRDPERAKGRRDWVLSRMAELGMITAAEAEQAQAEPLRLRPPDEPDTRAPYFVDYVRDQLAAQVPELANQIYTGGFRIYTTLDLDMQQAAEAAVQRLDDLVAPLEEHQGIPQPQVALIALDPSTGGIRAMVGGRDFETTPFNRAVRARRQPGSAFKPFLYTAVLAAGEPITTPVACRAREYPGGEGGRPYVPSDYGDERYHNAFLDIRRAVAISDNVVAVEWMNRVKPGRVAALARRMGITSPLTTQHLTLALGESAVTPLELARGYATLANLGQRVDPFAILRVEDRDGRVLFQHDPQAERVLAPDVAWLMTDVLKSVFDPAYSGTGRALGIGRPAAGKTGTTDASRDVWFVGYTPDLVAAVWVGADDNRQTVRLPGGAGATGSSTAGRIWQAFMRVALEGRPARDWPRPDGVVRASACTLTGALDNPQFQWREEWFLAGHVPPPNCLALLQDPHIREDLAAAGGAPRGLLPVPLPSLPELPGLPGLRPPATEPPGPGREAPEGGPPGGRPDPESPQAPAEPPRGPAQEPEGGPEGEEPEEAPSQPGGPSPGAARGGRERGGPGSPPGSPQGEATPEQGPPGQGGPEAPAGDVPGSGAGPGQDGAGDATPGHRPPAGPRDAGAGWPWESLPRPPEGRAPHP
ncbi:PBP1A family penicillin-binding protein [Thermaerobacter sp. PB12/4term]|uniref:transglycosylase domain-containing protein n=1 Tax=Thermaerobacter sp. PB12/4term TaxID=2293838 RepID=UPI000E32D18D|nr:PBP1A family penicillin-binding protein [Thermaerobacter sp. PB12/4term]QIA28093.1 PBP1A family penicillin-binding protein [Thermaerobacter sp. PB12/4term]